MFAKEIAESRPLDMKRFDSRAGYEFASRLLGTFGSERRNAIFRNYVDHVDTEGRGDYPGLMATCSKKSESDASYLPPARPTTGLPQSYAELVPEVFWYNPVVGRVAL